MKRGLLAALLLLAGALAPSSAYAECISVALKQSVRSATFSPDAKSLAIVTYEDTIGVWDVATGKKRFDLPLTALPLYSVGFTDDSKCILAVSSDGMLGVWTTSEGARVKEWRDARFRDARAIACKGDIVALGKKGGEILLRSLKDGVEIGELDGHISAVCFLGFSSSGKALVSCGRDQKVAIWDLQTKREVYGHREQGAVWAAAFSPDGSQLAYGAGMFHPVEVLSLVGNSTKRELERGDSTYVLVYSQDGTNLVSAGADGVIRVWDSAQNKLRFSLRGHNDAVLAIIYTPENRIVSLDAMGSLRKW